MVGIVDKVMGGLQNKETRQSIAQENASRHETGPEALALGKPSEYTVDDRIGGTHTRNVLDAVVHENVLSHAHHEVTPIVNRERNETEIHQKVQPVVDRQEFHTHHQHTAPHVARNITEDINEDVAIRYRSQGQYQHQQTIGDQTHSTSVNAPIVREHVNKHIIEEIQPIIQRQTQRVEHHHTTQQINEVHVKAPIIHSVVTNSVITMEEFAGKVSGLTHGRSGSSGSAALGTGNAGTGSTQRSGSGNGGLTNSTGTGLHQNIGNNSSTGTGGSASRY